VKENAEQTPVGFSNAKNPRMLWRFSQVAVKEMALAPRGS